MYVSQAHRASAWHDHVPHALSSWSRPLLTHIQHGNQFQRRCNSRSRQQNHDRRLHREPSNRQAHPSPRHYLVLQVRLGSRHAGRRRHCPISSEHVRHHKRRSSNHTNGGGTVSRAVLFQQGLTEVGTGKATNGCPCPPANTSTAPASSSQAGTKGMAGRSIRYH